MRPPTPVLILCAVLALAGCGKPTQQPPAVPAATCTPDGVRTAGPCTALDYEAQQGRQKRFAEAEKVLREVIAEEDKLYLARATEPSARMKELTADPYLKRKVGQLKSFAEETTQIEGSPAPLDVYLSGSARRPGAAVALCARHDTTLWTFSRDPAAKETGANFVNDYFFKERNGRLILFDAAGKGGAPCKN